MALCDIAADDFFAAVGIGELKQCVPVLQSGISSGENGAFGTEKIRFGIIEFGNRHWTVEQPGRENPARHPQFLRNRGESGGRRRQLPAVFRK